MARAVRGRRLGWPAADFSLRVHTSSGRRLTFLLDELGLLQCANHGSLDFVQLRCAEHARQSDVLDGDPLICLLAQLGCEGAAPRGAGQFSAAPSGGEVYGGNILPLLRHPGRGRLLAVGRAR